MFKFQNIENELIYSITHWYQPIYNLESNDILGYEALMRDDSLLKASPDEIFLEASKNGYRSSLDLISIKKALELFKACSIPLFLNVFPSTLLEEDFLTWWDVHVPPHKNIVLELLENEPVRSWEELKEVTGELKARGVKIAVDDMGEGYSFYQQWVELEPDFIKLDRYFSKDLSNNPRKQKVVSSLVALLSDSTEIIIEGIETENDLELAELLGINYAQGYLMGKPSPIDDLM